MINLLVLLSLIVLKKRFDERFKLAKLTDFKTILQKANKNEKEIKKHVI